MSVKKVVADVLWRITATPIFNKYRAKIFHSPYYVIEGKTKGKGFDLRSVVIGESDFLYYMINLIYHNSNYEIKITGKTTLDKANSISKKFSPDIVFARFHATLSNALSNQLLILPALTWTLDITPSIDVLVSKMKRLRRRNIKAIQKNDYIYECTKSAEMFDFFYNKMYVPYIRNAHGKSAKLVNIKVAENIFREGGLFLVKLKEKCASGILFSKKQGYVRCALLATNPEVNEELAGQAALYGLINWAKQAGYSKVDYGETSPFVGDGLFEYKRSWGMHVKPSLEVAYGIHLCNITNGVFDFLGSNPLVFAYLGDLAMLVFPNTSEICVDTLNRRYYTRGLSWLVLIHHKNRQISGLSSLNPFLRLLLSTHFQLENLQRAGYDIHALNLKENGSV